MRSRVDFPDPLGPANAANSPRAHLEADPFEHLLPAVGEGDVVRREHDGARGRLPSGRGGGLLRVEHDSHYDPSAPPPPTEIRAGGSSTRLEGARAGARMKVMAHDHDHGDVLRRTAARNVGRLWLALGLTLGFVVIEAITAFVAGSLSLLSDAAHMLTDAVAIGLALGAIVVANRASTEGSRTFGLFRLEILASLLNAILTFAVAAYVIVEAILRLVNGGVDIEAGPMLVVAVGGLVVNIVVFFMLRTGARDSLAVRGAYVDAMADTAGSIGVIVAAIVIELTGWTPIDAIVAAVIGIWIIPPRGASRRVRSACCCRSRPRASTSPRSSASCSRCRASSTSTTSTCGHSRRRWTSPVRT